MAIYLAHKSAFTTRTRREYSFLLHAAPVASSPKGWRIHFQAAPSHGWQVGAAEDWRLQFLSSQTSIWALLSGCLDFLTAWWLGSSSKYPLLFQLPSSPRLRHCGGLAPPAGLRARTSPEAMSKGAWHPAHDPGGLGVRPLLGCPEFRLRQPGSLKLPGWQCGVTGALRICPPARLLPSHCSFPLLPLLSPDCFSNALT